ncbi:alpha/beta hydrolase [Parendozoicomonas haliclonae]|uniref:alpha/beta hydrolase n=1 Tax=Parendozoicomonas haliclonae TaxID=1960125 RepID=UPI0013FD343F|nr:alpha/beta fold hydrolase [Parendozoicomonas haliclonae]
MFCTTPAQIGLPFESLELKTADGLRLSGWYIPGRLQGAGIVMVHGRGATRHEALRDAIALGEAGFPMLLIDLRNSGDSEASFNSMGFHEQKDVQAAVEYLQNRGKDRIGVVGYSMGASTSIMAMADNPLIKAGWFDSGFTDLDTIILDRGALDYGLPRNALFSGMVRFFYELRGDLETEGWTPVAVIASIAPRPVFIVHGTADSDVPVAHGRALYEAAKQPKTYWEIPGGEHTRAWQADPKLSAQLIQQFFLQALMPETLQQ